MMMAADDATISALNALVHDLYETSFIMEDVPDVLKRHYRNTSNIIGKVIVACILDAISHTVGSDTRIGWLCAVLSRNKKLVHLKTKHYFRIVPRLMAKCRQPAISATDATINDEWLRELVRLSVLQKRTIPELEAHLRQLPDMLQHASHAEAYHPSTPVGAPFQRTATGALGNPIVSSTVTPGGVPATMPQHGTISPLSEFSSRRTEFERSPVVAAILACFESPTELQDDDDVQEEPPAPYHQDEAPHLPSVDDA